MSLAMMPTFAAMRSDPRHLDVVMLHRGTDAMAIRSLEDVTPAPKVAASAPQSGDIEAAGDGTKCRRVAL
jgi:hypothetical protein